MSKLYLDPAAEKEANDIGKKFMNSSDVVGDMSRAYGADLSSVKIHTDDGAASKAAERGVDAFSTGKDVFFARGAFDQSDPASRGLLAHELSHSLQQGVGGEMAGTAQSAPMGAAQGGLISWFRNRKQRKAEEEARRREIENMRISDSKPHLDIKKNKNNNYLQMMDLVEMYKAPEAQMGESGGEDAMDKVGEILRQEREGGSIAEQADAVFKTQGAAAGLTKLGFRDKQWGMNDQLKASRGSLYSGMGSTAAGYAKSLKETGMDMQHAKSIYDGSTRTLADGKSYRSSELTNNIAQNFLNIASAHLLTDESADYLSNLSDQFAGLEMFDQEKGGIDLIQALIENIVLREAMPNAAAAGVMQGVDVKDKEKYAQAQAAQRLMYGAGNTLQKVFELSHLPDETVKQMPEELQSMFAQVKALTQQIEQKIANRKKAPV